MYISQAVECLLQATQIGLRNGLNDLVAESAHCLVECVGDRDTNASCQFLALYQVSQLLKSIIKYTLIY